MKRFDFGRRGDPVSRVGLFVRAAVLASLCVGSAAMVAACGGDGASPGDAGTSAALSVARTVAPPVAETPTAVGRVGAGEGVAQPAPGILPLQNVGDKQVVTATMQTVAFDQGVDARPGPWSPDGAHLAAFVVVDNGDDSFEGTVARVWTVDAASGEPLWDSGDVQDGLDRAAGLAAWRTDGTLVLPRADGMIVDPDGTVAADVADIGGQPRDIALSPDGATVFANGPDGSWLIGSNGGVRAVEGRPSAGFDNWSWRQDGAALGLARASGDYYVVDVASGAAERVAKAPATGQDARIPAPRWLVNDRLLLSNATTTRTAGGATLDHRIVNPDGGRSDSLPALLGIQQNVTMPYDASPWVSPDGAWIVYPVTEPDTGSADGGMRYVLRRSLLVDVTGGLARDLPPMFDPVWSNDSAHVAFRTDEALAVFDRVGGSSRVVAEPADGVVAYAWSPTGDWLLYTDAVGALWIVAANGLSRSARLADAAIWSPAPTWSPSGDRFAVAVVDRDAGPRLTMFSVGLESDTAR